jgi:hypothetical protein
MVRYNLRGFLLVGSLWVLGMTMAAPAFAHHSVQAEFDIRKVFTITGTIAKIEEINPHSFMTINVKDANGNIQKWGFEFGGPGSLRKAGLARDGLKIGDQVTIKAAAAKDGSTSGLLQELTLPDGRTLKLSSEAPDGGDKTDKDGAAK